jgi:hypothetical protein
MDIHLVSCEVRFETTLAPEFLSTLLLLQFGEVISNIFPLIKQI